MTSAAALLLAALLGLAGGTAAAQGNATPEGADVQESSAPPEGASAVSYGALALSAFLLTGIVVKVFRRGRA